MPATKICACRVEKLDEVLDYHDHVVGIAATVPRDGLWLFKNDDTVRLESALTLDRAVLDARTGLNAFARGQRRDVQEHLDAVISLDETEALVVVEEFHFSGGQARLLDLMTRQEETWGAIELSDAFSRSRCRPAFSAESH